MLLRNIIEDHHGCRHGAGAAIMGAGAAIMLAVVIMASIFYLLDKFDAPPPERSAESDRRVADWAYIAQRKMISGSEELVLVVVPSPLGETFDQQCLLYRNTATGQSDLTCPAYAELADRFEIDDY